MGNTNKIKKWIFRIIGIVILGIFVNALYEAAARPLFISGIHLLLNIITLGSESLKNGAYADIARGYHEASEILLLKTAVVIGFIAAFWIFFLYVISLRKKMAADKGEQFSGGKEIRSHAYYTAGIMFLWSFLMLISAIKIGYSNQAISHFEQSFSICRPFLNDTQEKNIRSQFAQIKNKEDYIRVMAMLEQVATNNRIKLPKFSVW